MKTEKFTGQADKIDIDYLSASLEIDKSFLYSKRHILQQKLLSALPKETNLAPKVMWRGPVEDFFTFFTVAADIEWKDLAKWMGIGEANLEALRKNQSTYIPYIKRTFLETFFLNLPPVHFAAANDAMELENRQQVFKQLALLGVCDETGSDMPRNYIMWTTNNNEKFEAYLNQNGLTRASVAPSAFEKTPSKPENLPCRMRSIALFRLGWNMARINVLLHLTTEDLKKQLQGNALLIFNDVTHDFWTNDRILRRLPWNALVRGKISNYQKQYKISDRKILKGLGYTGQVALDRSEKSVIDIDRLISLARHFAAYVELSKPSAEIFNISELRARHKAATQKPVAQHKAETAPSTSSALIAFSPRPKQEPTVTQAQLPASTERKRIKTGNSKSWADSDAETCRNMAMAGKSAAQIAAEIPNKSRNAVIGFCNRNSIRLFGNSGRNTDNTHATDKKRVRATRKSYSGLSGKQRNTTGQDPAHKTGAEKQITREYKAALLLFVGTGKIPLSEANENQCHWPLEIEKTTMACGEKMHAKGYCLSHYKLAYRPR